MTSVRNPVSSFLLTTLTAAGLSFVAAIGSLLLPYMEFRLFYLGFALFAVGFLAGRMSYVGFIGFFAGYVGGLVGLYSFLQLFWYLPWYWFWLITAGFAGSCGLGSAVSAKLVNRHLDHVIEAAPKTRRCQRCGAKVGVSARKCWDCKAPLPM